MSFTLSILGRPNVGKSTLFNRLVGRRLALVDDEAGVTRDRRISPASLYDLEFDVIDTAGLSRSDISGLESRMFAQSERALLDCDIALFLFDARSGINHSDSEFSNFLRKSGKPIILVANKCEGNIESPDDAYSLGLGSPILISAEHGDGMIDLRDAIIDVLGSDISTPTTPDTSVRPLTISIVGRPNSGKSTLINRIVGDDRVLTGEESGITRDSVSVDWHHDGRLVRLFDTAGIRRRSRVSGKLEKLSIMDTLRTVRYSEVVVVLFDSTISFEKQDLHIVDRISSEGRALVLVFNKWDLVRDKSAMRKELNLLAQEHLPQLSGLRTVMLSGKTGFGLSSLWRCIFESYEVWNRRISTSRLNRWLIDIQHHHSPPMVSGIRIKLKYITQLKARPPTFIVYVSKRGLPESYVRYLRNSLRDSFGLRGVPVRIMLRYGLNPYASVSVGTRRKKTANANRTATANKRKVRLKRK